ncbi:hypothetical protein ACHWQZ_G016076 [Mnemiopsis leidyi]
MYCIDRVKLILHKLDGNQFLMNNGEISVIDSQLNNKKMMCGILIVRDIPTREGQTYYIECEKYICGDKIRLDVYRKEEDGEERSISMKEVTTYIATDCKYIPEIWAGVTTVPALPVPDKTVLTLTCGRDNSLFSGSSETTCVQGKPYSVGKDPNCSTIGKIV